jgi:hypothetical protein
MLMTSMATYVEATYYDIYLPDLSVYGNGVVWRFSIINPYDGTPYFSFDDLNKVTLVGLVWADGNADPTSITPFRIDYSEKSHTVTLLFHPRDLPKSADANAVAGTLNDDGTFTASGPGWMWRSGGG